MPTYVFSDPATGERHEVVMAIAEMQKRTRRDGTIRRNGRVLVRDHVAEHSRSRRSGNAWPMKSDAMGVHPDQIPEAMEQAKRAGVPTDFASDGRAILTGPRHRKVLGESLGFYDRNGGYGDPQRR